MHVRWRLFVLSCVLAGLLAPGLTWASTGLYAETRVRGLHLGGPYSCQGQLRPMAELDGAGAIVSRFVYGTGVNVPAYLVRGGATYRVVTDHLGSVRLVVNAGTGAVAQQLEYDPFGRVVLDTSPGFQPFGFAGGLYDPLTGLVRFGVRDYNPTPGRWLAQDPIGFAGGDTNLYAYVGNDPLNAGDPTGLFVWDLVDLVFLGQDLVAFIQCPGTGTGFWVAASALGALPGIASLGWVRGANRLAARGASAVTRNVQGGVAAADDALRGAQKWLGEGYKEIAPGVFRSEDGLRQFRMTASDLADPKLGPHVHFEAIRADPIPWTG